MCNPSSQNIDRLTPGKFTETSELEMNSISLQKNTDEPEEETVNILLGRLLTLSGLFLFVAVFHLFYKHGYQFDLEFKSRLQKKLQRPM